MIEKLEEHSVDELRKKIEELGPFGDIFSGVIKQPLKPTDEEIIAKINEIIEHVNKLERGGEE